MTITSEIQKLEPGALVELFELDATGIGGDHNYFHAQTQYQTIWWQGNEYYPWPVQTENFARTSDKPPTPTLAVGNVDGSISALCIYFDDLVGAKVVRRRTLARFLDSNNFPALTATAQQFGVGDGVKKTFALTGGPSGPSMNFVPTAIHQTNWEGRRALSNAPRTNICAWSEDLTKWGKSADLTVTNDNTTYVVPGGPALQHVGGSTIVTSVVNTALPNAVVGKTYKASMVFHPGSSTLIGLQVYNVATFGYVAGVNFTWVNGVASIATSIANVIEPTVEVLKDGSSRVSFKFVVPAGANLKFQMQPDRNAAKADVYAGAAQVCDVDGVYIKTATTTATVTDYTPGDAGAITVGQAPTLGATLDWDGTYQNNPTADPAEELPPEVWFIERKTSETMEAVQFELSSAMDFNGVMLPRRQIIANACPFKYRSSECSYTGAPVADINDNPTTDATKDRCGKRLGSCRLRFGSNKPLPYGGFPAAGLLRS